MNTLPLLELDPFPEIDLRHLLILTDGTGILQHAVHATPDPNHGYCTDDNARALIAGVMFYSLQPDVRDEGTAPDELSVAVQRYLSFLSYAFNGETGRFRNFMNYDRTWLEEVGSEDSHARALWGLGAAFRLGHTESIRGLAKDLFEQALPAARGFAHIKPWAYAVLGMNEYLLAGGDDPLAEELLSDLAGRLFDRWRKNRDDEWPWWEDRLTWGNAKLPHALLAAGGRLEREDMVEAGLVSLRWLQEVQSDEEGRFSIIGNRGWFFRGRERARFDQQPIEAKATVQACLAAAYLTRDDFWTKEAERSFRWFLGENEVGAVMYDRETGGCRDGLGPERAADNQGAESTLAYLMSVLELHHYQRAARASREIGL